MEINSLKELELLNKMILEAKFSKDPIDERLIGSPYTAEIANKVYDSIIDELKKNEAESLEFWLLERKMNKQSHSKFYEIGSSYAKKIDGMRFSKEKKTKYIRDVFSPFEISDELLEEILREIE